MGRPTFLRLAPNQIIAELWVESLSDAGYSTITKQPTYPYPHAAAPVEIWLQDGELMDRPDIAAHIEQILEAKDTGVFPNEIQEGPERKTWFRWWHLVPALLVLFVLWAAIFAHARKPEYRFLIGAREEPLSTKRKEFFEKNGLVGKTYVLRKPFKETVSMIRNELAPKQFVEETRPDRTFFFRDRKENDRTTFDEAVAVFPIRYLVRLGEVPQIDPNYTEVSWYYNPSPSEDIGHRLGR